MALFEWTDDLRIDVALIDTQHRRLIEAINAFYEGISTRQSNAALAQLLKFMIDYLQEHFSTEEGLMRKHGYPDLDRHSAQHQGFVDETRAMVDRYVEGRLLLSIEVTSFLRTWLINHIQVTDKALGQFLRAHGAQ
jgi:hemerythrin